MEKGYFPAHDIHSNRWSSICSTYLNVKYFPRTVLTIPALTQIPTLTYMKLTSFPAANHLVPLPKNIRTHRFPQFLPTSAKPNVITRTGDCSSSLQSPASMPLSACGGYILPLSCRAVAERRVRGTQTVFAAAKILSRCLKWDDVAFCTSSREQADGFKVKRTSLEITQADCLQGLCTQIHQSAPKIICPRNLKRLPTLNEIVGAIQPGLRGNISHLNHSLIKTPLTN